MRPATRNAIATLTPSPTLTPTTTPTPTRTYEPTAPPAPTEAAPPAIPVVINEIAWAGTGKSDELARDEWIELYNPGASALNISGWKLIGNRFELVFPAGTYIAGKGYYLIERREQATSVRTDLVFAGLALPNWRGHLYLFNPRANQVVDRANFDGGPWPAGSAASFASMERSLLATDSPRVWVTYDPRRDGGLKARNAAGAAILGTLGRANRPLNVTPSPAH